LYLNIKISKWVKNPSDYILVTRFLGTTVQTSNIFKVYCSIALQLIYAILSMQHEINQEELYQEYCKCQNLQLIKSFIIEELELIKLFSPNKKVVFILDSLDQLTPSDYKNVEKWFFTELPTNLKLIASTLPDHGNLLNMIVKIIVKKRGDELGAMSIEQLNTPGFKSEKMEKIFLEINELDSSQCETILKEWLVAKKRNLTESQWSDLRVLFSKSNLLPLFLKLVYDVVLYCQSFEKFNEAFLQCTEIDDIILYIFTSLEKIHGLVFRRAICYMTVCKNGINNNELEDILSLGKHQKVF
jgi:hypothetical protein